MTNLEYPRKRISTQFGQVDIHFNDGQRSVYVTSEMTGDDKDNCLVIGKIPMRVSFHMDVNPFGDWEIHREQSNGVYNPTAYQRIYASRLDKGMTTPLTPGAEEKIRTVLQAELAVYIKSCTKELRESLGVYLFQQLSKAKKKYFEINESLMAQAGEIQKAHLELLSNGFTTEHGDITLDGKTIVETEEFNPNHPEENNEE